ncbi:hypothetical protein JCM3770_002133 [Rhodotorula araucariae]
MADSTYPAKSPRRKRSHKTGLSLECPPDDAKRVPMACIACRKRKIRCDGQQPSCNNCTKNGKNGCRYERVTAEENQEVKIRKRLAKLRKEHGPKGYEVDAPSQLSTRRRWSRTISFDKDYDPVAPTVTSSGSLPCLTPSPTGLSTATHQLSLEQQQARSAAFSPRRQGYFDHSGSPYPITPHDEPTGYFVPIHAESAAAAAAVYGPVSAQASPYPLTPPMEDSYGCDPSCTCHYAAAAAIAQQQQQQQVRRPAFGWSQSAPQLPTMHAYPRSPYGQPQPIYSPALSPDELPEACLPQPPAYLLNNNELPAPIPVRPIPQPSFIRVDQPTSLVVHPPVYPSYPPTAAVQQDAFLAPEAPATWADAFVEDDIPLDCAGAWTEPWVGPVQSKAAPLDEYSGFEQEAW